MAESFGGIGVFSAFSTPLLEVLHAELCSLKFFFRASLFSFLRLSRWYSLREGM